MALAEIPMCTPSRHAGPSGGSSALQARMHVEGKFFAHGGERLRVRGVTYGPFAPDARGDQFPSPARASDDFALMRKAGINAIRTYHVPPEWLLELADDHALRVFIDVPWPKHVCFLDSQEAQRHARRAVRRAATVGRRHPCVLAYSIGNEIPPSIVRWHGAPRVEHFLATLADVVKQTDPEGLATYASFPPTEYLDVSFLDFLTFNVYLHDPETFRRYLFRLQNLVGDKPLVLGELGMDTYRHGEEEQARFLAGHVREATLMGLAGTFVFAWTDDWFTGGHRIEDWAFGITTAERNPKRSYHVLEDTFKSTPAELLANHPRVSVVVCSYNGGKTLRQCLRSLQELDYPDYEVLVVDDGSTDGTPAILDDFPDVGAVRQPNRGLSFARNAGLQAATGSVIAYTDSDCYADRDWLTHLVYQLEKSGAAAVGGPNLTPEDGWLAGCVAAAPGQPSHVLESDQVAEHIPGCNMAFRREALELINGFDPRYRKAGDDVDVCWRLQQAGHWITFAPGAIVWHHRRQTPRTFLKQQAGYGEAEGLLRFKHPDKFNGRGDGKWRGVLYGVSLLGLRFGQPLVYRSTFGTGLFQCIYQPGTAHWAMLPSTLEWHAVAALCGLGGLLWSECGYLAVGMLVLSILVALLQAAQARLAPHHEGLRARALIAGLCYLQPLVRGWVRYRTRLFRYRVPAADPAQQEGCPRRLPWSGRCTTTYWSEDGTERTDLLGQVIGYLNEHRWGRVIDSGWSDWDLEVCCSPWASVVVCTAQEEHGSGKRLIRVRYQMRTSTRTRLIGAAGILVGAVALALELWVPALAAVLLLALCGCLWRSGTTQAGRVVRIVDYLAERMQLLRCEEKTDPAVSTPGVNGGEPLAPGDRDAHAG